MAPARATPAAVTADDEPSVPPLLRPSVIAKACKVTRKVALTELRNAGLLDRNGEGKGRPWRVSASRLRERHPDYYDRVYRHFVLKQLK